MANHAGWGTMNAPNHSRRAKRGKITCTATEYDPELEEMIPCGKTINVGDRYFFTHYSNDKKSRILCEECAIRVGFPEADI